MASFLPGLRRAAPRLANDFFICHHCKKYARPAARQIKIPGKANLSRTIRFNSSAPTFPELAPKKTSPLSSLSQTISNAEKERTKGGAKKGFFPETSSNAVAYWLLASAGSVFGIVVFGGLTRLTESGYVLLPFSLLQTQSLLIISQSQHHGMETRNRLSPAPLT